MVKRLSKKSKKSKPLIYCALGDSLTVGIGSLLKPGFVKRYASMVEREVGRKVIPFTFAKHGITSKDLCAKIDEPVVQFVLKQANIITITIGGNDLRRAGKKFFLTSNKEILSRAAYQYEQNIKHIIKKIRTIKSQKKIPYYIRIIDFYNPFPGYQIAEQWVYAFHKQLKSFEKRHIKVTNVFHAYQGREHQLLFLDKLHPNAAGYQIIAEELYKTGFEPFKPLN